MNDAPALKAANVGIAVAGATPAAQGAADIILTQARSIELHYHQDSLTGNTCLNSPARCKQVYTGC